MRWSYRTVSTTPNEFITLDEVKKNLDVTFTDDDDMIEAHIEAAVGWIQDYTGHILIPTVIELTVDELDDQLYLPFTPIQGLASMSIGGQAYSPRVIAGSPFQLLPLAGSGWPYLSREMGAAVITYNAGYPAGQVPKVFIQAVKMIVSIFYDKPQGKELESQWAAVRDFLSGKRVRSL